MEYEWTPLPHYTLFLQYVHRILDLWWITNYSDMYQPETVHKSSNIRATGILSRIWGSHGGESEDGCLLSSSGNRLMMEAARTSETLVNFYQTTRCYNPEHSHLCTGILPHFINLPFLLACILSEITSASRDTNML
jgi:hypothetical protein